MSLAKSPLSESDVQTDECARDDCDVEFDVHRGAVAGSYCSRDCAWRDQGGVLKTIVHDHRFCATCFARIKETVSPDDDWRERHASALESALDQGGEFVAGEGGQMVLDATDCDHHRVTSVDAVIGVQYLTDQADHGLRSLPSPDASDRATWAPICQCGNTDHSHHEPEFDGEDTVARAYNLIALLEFLRDEDKAPRSPDGAALMRNVRVDGEVSWRRAIGAALQEDPRR
ncbi:hypothetical protein J2752_000434 [Halarchaeum rubridurum]|uniref:Uncharacterized protein n=1 Tax=Halarchaeum rubridurum TaxID=489911 RepID=A0A830FRG2_9EURY|nr:hypothetical protein [Halarchaeum rubridurum]MBP1953553.1 hypothetical protein [Halarchaeum rubridurum]GGM64409.1 hypothetical protein GCM10009017_13070 [Halarchaeum rubridurum]